MKILILIHEYPPIGGGGGQVAQDIARGLVKLGHEVTALVPRSKGQENQVVEDGVHIVRIRSFRREPFVGDLLAMSGYLISGFFTGLWLVFRFRPDVIHVHFAVPAGVLAWMLSKLTGIPYILTSHLGDVPGGVPEKTDHWFKWVYPFTPRIWRDAAVVTAISDFTRALALIHYPVDIKVIPNGITLASEIQRAIEVNHPPRIIFAGRFVSQKNPALIPQILDKLRDLDWECIMLGDGELTNEVERSIHVLGLQGRVILTGWKSPDEVNDILSKSDILFLPSKTEGIPMIGLQALAQGLAIVASDVGGMHNLVLHGVNGFLQNPSDLDGFGKNLRFLLSDGERLQSFRKASLLHVSQFDIDEIVKKYEKTLFESSKKRG